MEPITYANGSTLEDPAISYGIVFSATSCRKGVFTFQGGTDKLIKQMEAELKQSGVDVAINCDATKINLKNGKVESIEVDAKGATHTINCDAVVSQRQPAANDFRPGGRRQVRHRLHRRRQGRAAQQQ